VDFSGVWQKPYSPDMTKVGGADSKALELPFTEWGLAEWKSYHPEDGDYTGACLPFGLSRSVNTPEPMQIVQNDKYFTLLFEQNNWYTVVPIDGRKHREIDSTWFGDSVGHWEGDTLVIDTTNFTNQTRFRGSDENLHLTERFTLTDPGTLLYRFTVDDPTAFTKPWTGEIPLVRAEGPLYEYACNEGNTGMAGILSAARTDEKKAAGDSGSR